MKKTYTSYGFTNAWKRSKFLLIVLKSRTTPITVVIATAIYVSLQLVHAEDIKRNDMPMNKSRDTSVYKRLEILDKSVQALRKEIQGAVVAVPYPPPGLVK